jgi:hypothetical protein
MEFDDLSNRVLGCAIEVHRHLGPGLLESANERCLAYELSCQNIAFRLQVAQPVRYKIELKAVEKRLGIHESQLLTYMKLAQIKIGLLVNFNVPKLKDDIRRFVL